MRRYRVVTVAEELDALRLRALRARHRRARAIGDRRAELRLEDRILRKLEAYAA